MPQKRSVNKKFKKADSLLRSRFFRFSTNLTKNLSLRRTWSILIAVVTLLYLIISATLYVHVNSVVQRLALEQKGISLLTPIFKTIQNLQQHRGYSAGALGGAKDLSNLRLIKLDETILSFNLASKTLTPKMLNKDEWQEIILLWQELVSQGMNWSREKNLKFHSSLVNKIIKFSVSIADDYALTNQAEIDAHYLLSTIFLQLLPSQEYLGQLRAMTIGIISNKSSTEYERDEVVILLSKSRTAILLLQQNLIKTGDFNPLIQKELLITAKNITSNSQYVFDLVETTVLQKKYSIEPSYFFEIITNAIDSTYATQNNILIPTIEELIKKRIDNENQYILVGGITFLIAALFLLYFSMGIYIASMHNIHYLSDTTLKFANGDFSHRIKINPNSELFVLGSSFNHMADQIANLLENLQYSSFQIQNIMDSAIDAIVQIDQNGNLTGWSHQAESIFGWKEQEVIGKPMHQFIVPDNYRKAHCDGLTNFINTGKNHIIGRVVEIEALNKEGLQFPIELVISKVRKKIGYEFCAFIRDISERKKNEESLNLSAKIFEHSIDGILITDSNANIIDVNPAFYIITGYTKEEVIGKNPRVLTSGTHPALFFTNLWKALTVNDEWKGEVWNRKKSGELYAEKLNISVVKNEKGKPKYYIGIFSDITSAKIQKEKQIIQNLHDKNQAILDDILGTISSKTTKIYNGMKPKIAADIFNRMIQDGRIEEVFDIILKLKEKKVTLIMKFLSLENASLITHKLEKYKVNN